MEPKGPEKVPEPEPDDPEETDEAEEADEAEETLKDAFGNEGLKLWWVPMEFTHKLEDSSLVRVTFQLKVAGDDEYDARENANLVDMDDIVDRNPEFDGFDADDIVTTLEYCDSVCEAEHEPWDGEEIVLQVNEDLDAEECLT